MPSTEKLLILDVGAKPSVPGARSATARALDSIRAAGVVFRHSSGRIVIVEASSEQQARLRADLPEAQLLPVDTDVAALVPDLDTSELLFLEAFRIRNSAAYQNEKTRQIPGESPEEQLMFTAPCIPGGQSNG